MNLIRIGFGLLLLASVAHSAPYREKPDEEPPKVDWSAKRFDFELDGKTWEEALAWFAAQAQMTVETTKWRVPRGTIDVTFPKGRKYSLAEIYDFINHRLQAEEKFTLLRGARKLTLFPADEVKEIPANLVPVVRVHDLHERGQTEIVAIVIMLRAGQTVELFNVEGGKDLRSTWTIPHTALGHDLYLVQADVAALRALIQRSDP